MYEVQKEISITSINDFLKEQREFSEKTFGVGLRTKGIIQHITKELKEIEKNPHDLTEWVDVILLALDGYWRHGGLPQNILKDMEIKLVKNKNREWPKNMSEDEAVEHIK